MKTLNEIEELLIGKREENQRNIQEFTDKKEVATQAIQRANKELVAAEVDVNLEVYKKSKDDLWSAKHAIELYDKQIENLTNIPLISKEEYNKLVDEIFQATNATYDEQDERALLLVAELKEIADESNQTWNKADKLLNILQRQVYREPEGRNVASDGSITFSMDKKYTRNGGTVYSFYQGRVRGSYLSQRVGEQQTVNKIWL